MSLERVLEEPVAAGDPIVPTLTISPLETTSAIAESTRRLTTGASWAPWILAAALPALFLHIRYQPKVSAEVGSTSIDVTLADAAIAAVFVAAVLRARRDGFAPLRAARFVLVSAGALVVISLLSLMTPSLLGEDYAVATHAVSALKFAWYALLLPAVILIVRKRSDASPLMHVTVAWSAVATSWGLLQFLGLVSEFEGRRPGQREPSFVGIHDFAALSGAALALGVASLVWSKERPLRKPWITAAVVSGAVGIVLSGAMTGVAGIWLATAAIFLVARSRESFSPHGAAVAVACVLAVTAGTTLMRADAIERLAEFIGIRDKTEETGAESYPQRVLLAYIGTKVWLEHPIIGVGWQASSEEWAFEPHLDDARRRFPDQPESAFPSREHPWGVQNLYIQTLADLGVVGMVATLALFGTTTAAALRGARTSWVPLIGLAWLLVCVGVWGGLGIVAGIPLLALTWISVGLAAVRE